MVAQRWRVAAVRVQLCRGGGSMPWQVVTPALNCIGNVVRGTDDQAQAALSCGVVPVLTALLTHARTKVWLLSASHVHVACVCASHGSVTVVPVVALLTLQHGTRVAHWLFRVHAQIRTSACQALSHIATGTPVQVQAVIDAGAMPTAVSMLRVRVHGHARCWQRRQLVPERPAQRPTLPRTAPCLQASHRTRACVARSWTRLRCGRRRCS